MGKTTMDVKVKGGEQSEQRAGKGVDCFERGLGGAKERSRFGGSPSHA